MNHVRHSSLFDASQLAVTLVGAGGIGAISAVTLAKMGVGFLTLYDDDVVSEENMATQLHRLNELGNTKVSAIEQLIKEFSDDTLVFANYERVEEGSELQDQIIISAVDSIAARKAIWEVSKGYCRWYLDARMAAEELHLYCVDQKDTAWYEQILDGEDDSNVVEAPCTSKATFFVPRLPRGSLDELCA